MENIVSILNEFWSKVTSLNFKKTSDSYPPSLETIVQLAVQQKREGKYLESVKTYIELMVSQRIVYSSLLSYLYKVVASAGYLAEGLKILRQGKSIYDSNPSPISFAFGITSAFEDHMSRLKDSIVSEHKLFQYLESISGSLNYKFNRTYHDMYSDLKKYDPYF